MCELVGSAIPKGDGTHRLIFRRDSMGIPVAVCYEEPFDSFDLNKLSQARPMGSAETSQYILVWWSGSTIDILGDASVTSWNECSP